MSLLKDVSIEAIRRMPENATVEDIVDEIYIIRDVLVSEEERAITKEELMNLVIPEEEISDEERQEILKIKAEMERGKERRLEDVLAELNV